MNKKKIIGLIGDKEGRDIISNILISNRYYKISIEDRVKIVADVLSVDNDLNTVRNRGYNVGSKYWINLVLSMIPKDKDLIVIDDLRLEDVIENIMKVYYVSEKKEEKVPIGIELINKGKDIEEFKKLVNEKFGH
jgi:hypothetical protein